MYEKLREVIEAQQRLIHTQGELIVQFSKEKLLEDAEARRYKARERMLAEQAEKSRE